MSQLDISNPLLRTWTFWSCMFPVAKRPVVKHLGEMRRSNMFRCNISVFVISVSETSSLWNARVQTWTCPKYQGINILGRIFRRKISSSEISTYLRKFHGCELSRSESFVSGLSLCETIMCVTYGCVMSRFEMAVGWFVVSRFYGPVNS